MSELVLPGPTPTTIPVEGGGLFPVRRIYCVGRNYASHVREMKEADERDPPFFFQKPRDAVVCDGATLAYPSATDDFQHEVERVAAIGASGRNIGSSHALGYIWGYAVGLDMTRRDRQREARELMLPWEAGKSFDQSAPCGAIHSALRVGHPAAGAITLSVNGQTRQKGDLSEMIWSVPEIIAQLSRQVRLEPGDLIMTGTPAGVGSVHAGDNIVGAIEGIGSLTVTISSTAE
jgi:fumarylpyruvate hydrolase